MKILKYIDATNEIVGKLVSWLCLLMVFTTFAVVVLRYMFNVGWIWMQESITYMHAILFMAAAGYTLLHNEHVKIDIIYNAIGKKKKLWIDIGGTLFLLFPTCILILYYGFPYVIDSWSVLETSKESGGLPFLYLLKSFILIFPSLLILQGSSSILKCFQEIKTIKK